MNLFIGSSSSDDILLDSFEMCGSVIQSLASCGDYDLVIGGNAGGLMKVTYNAFKDNNRMVTGIIASRWKNDLDTMDCDISVITEDTFERQQQIMNHSDILLFMPGGIGTMSEFFGMLEDKRTYEIAKPMILYNEDKSFDALLHMMDKMIKDGYMKKENKNNYKVVYNQEELFDYLNQIKKEQDISKVK